MLLLAISHGAELLILDEPAEGLDPVAVEECCANWWRSLLRREPRFSSLRTTWKRWSRLPITSASSIAGPRLLPVRSTT